jgi:hypothetical protein
MNYNIFTKAEKYAIINILTAIMEADCIIHPKEIEFMDSIFKSFCISAKDNEHMENLDVYGSINIINNMSKDKKEISTKEKTNFYHNCPNCGAPINPYKERCEYCDTYHH